MLDEAPPRKVFNAMVGGFISDLLEEITAAIKNILKLCSHHMRQVAETNVTLIVT